MRTRIKKDIEIVLFVQAEIIILSIIAFIDAHLIGLSEGIIDKLPVGLIIMDMVVSYTLHYD